VDVVLVVVDIDDVALVIRFVVVDKIISAVSIAYVAFTTKRKNDETPGPICLTD
jgi:hypothetical protein